MSVRIGPDRPIAQSAYDSDGMIHAYTLSCGHDVQLKARRWTPATKAPCAKCRASADLLPATNRPLPKDPPQWRKGWWLLCWSCGFVLQDGSSPNSRRIFGLCLGCVEREVL